MVRACRQFLQRAIFGYGGMSKTRSRRDCVSCSNVESKSRLRVAPCGHYFCLICLERMVRLAIQDRMLAPVRCCRKELPIEYVKTALKADKEDLTTYLRFLKERKWTESDLVSDTEYATVVKSMGAKQCPGCGIGVERDFGCIHMRCPNGHEFCFTCLRVWQTCNCALIPPAEINAILGPE